MYYIVITRYEKYRETKKSLNGKAEDYDYNEARSGARASGTPAQNTYRTQHRREDSR